MASMKPYIQRIFQNSSRSKVSEKEYDDDMMTMTTMTAIQGEAEEKNKAEKERKNQKRLQRLQ